MNQGRLPYEPGGFIGRAQQLEELWSLLGSRRLVTITGMGGIGKTRVAVKIAHQLRPRFPDGVHYVDMASATDPGMVAHFVNSALGLADQSHRPALDMLADWARQRRMLLVLDTCEHLVGALAPILERLLEEGPGLTLLLTSRQPVGLRGEAVVPVPPFRVPYEDPAEPVGSNEAVQLFLTRAAAIRPELDHDAVLDQVAALCREVDGIPLAIELAAAQLHASDLDEVLSSLAARLLPLAGADDPPSRHLTLRTTIGWSHELCDPGERLLWARLSVFRGSFDLEAAQGVCADATLPARDIPELLRGLADKSVILPVPGASRFRLVALLQEYGAEWMERLGGVAELRSRHARHFLALAQRAESEWSGPDQLYWSQRLMDDDENLSAAIEHCLSTPGKARDGLRLLSDLWFVWIACGRAPEGRLYLERALNQERQPSSERCRALWALSYICSAQGDISTARSAAEESFNEALLVGDSSAVIHARKMQGTAALLMGDLPKAVALLGTVFQFNKNTRQLNPGLLPAIVEISLALARWNEAAAAEDLLKDCVQLCAEQGELWLRSHAHWALATVQLQTGGIDAAHLNLAEALRIKQEFSDVVGLLMALEAASHLAVAQGDYPRAAILVGATEANWSQQGLPLFSSPFFTEDHKQSVAALKEASGTRNYEELRLRGASLNLAQTVAFALSDRQDKDLEQVLEEIATLHQNVIVVNAPVPIKIYLSDENGHEVVLATVLELARTVGLEITHEFRAVAGSWFKQFTARFRSAAGTEEEAMAKSARALEMAVLHERQAAIDSIQAEAFSKLAASLEKFEKACVQVGSFIVVKDSNGIRCRQLSQLELHHLERAPDLFKNPSEVMAELERLPDQDGAATPSNAPPDMTMVHDALICWCGSGRSLISCHLTPHHSNDTTPS